MSSNANLVAEPWMALIIGFAGGAACSFGIHHARPFWVKRIQMHDTVGVTSMHLYPGGALRGTRERAREREREREREL